MNKSKIWENFTNIDPRGYVCLRVGLGFSIILDLLISRFGYVEMFLSDQGVNPRKLLTDYAEFSLFFASGGTAWAYFLLILLFISSVTLMIGLWTRVSIITCYILLLSLHWRIAFTLGGPDRLHLLILMWALFLPLGKHGSIDSFHKYGTFFPNIKDTLNERLAVLGLILLESCMFLVAAWCKIPSIDWYTDFTSLFFVLNTGYHTTPIGHALRHQLALTKLLTFSTLAMEWSLGILILIPMKVRFFRALFSILIILLKIGFGSMLFVSFFPLIGILMGLFFMPEFLWNKLCSNEKFSRLTSRFLLDLSLKTKDYSVPDINFNKNLSPLLSIFLCYNLFIHIASNTDDVFNWELGNSSFELATKKYIKIFRLDQKWIMFRNAPRWFSWQEIILNLEDGTKKDIWRKEWQGSDEISTTWPDRTASAFKNSLRLYLYFVKIADPKKNSPYHTYYAFYQCKKWNSENKIKVKSIDLFNNLKHWKNVERLDTFPRKLIWSYKCPQSTMNPSDGIFYKY